MSLPSCVAAALVTATLVLTAATPASAEQAVGGRQLATSGTVVAPNAPALPEVGAASWLVADLDTGEVLAAKDPHGAYAPASTLKMLTAVALLPVLDRSTVVTPTFDDVNIEGSKVGLVERVGYPAEELFASLLMVSGNDSANALATAAGGQEATAALMNAKARDLGAADTRAVNPHGLDAEGQVSSAYDLALIARAGLAEADFARYVSTRRSSVSAPLGEPRIEIVNKNKLLAGYEGALGVKNGFTSRARASFVGAAERDGRRLVVTLMKSVPKVFDEAQKLLDWGFAARSAQPVGMLVDPAGEAEEAESLAAVALTGPSASGPVSTGSGTAVPTTLAGLALGVAAIAAVRPRPAPTRAPARQPVPAQRTVIAREPARR